MPTDLQALVRAPAWRWMGGMWWDTRIGGTCPLCDGYGGYRWREADGSENGAECPCAGRIELYPSYRNDGHNDNMRASGVLPDITDPATLGCMLALAREAWADPTLHVVCARGRWWAVSTQFEGGPGHETEGEALAAAILVASVLTHG